jgi:hypothetical protein
MCWRASWKCWPGEGLLLLLLHVFAGAVAAVVVVIVDMVSARQVAIAAEHVNSWKC